MAHIPESAFSADKFISTPVRQENVGRFSFQSPNIESYSRYHVQPQSKISQKLKNTFSPKRNSPKMNGNSSPPFQSNNHNNNNHNQNNPSNNPNFRQNNYSGTRTTPTTGFSMNIKDRIQYACKLPRLRDAIVALENIICNETSLKELAQNLQYLFNFIFSLENIQTSGDIIYSNSSFILSNLYSKKLDNSYISNNLFEDANAVLNFLSPDHQNMNNNGGILFQKLYELDKKKIFPKIDDNLQLILKKFCKIKIVNYNQTPNNQMNNNNNYHHQDSIDSNIGLNNFSRNYQKVGQELCELKEKQVSAFELFFYCFAIYGIVYDRSHEDLINFYANEFNRNRNNFHNGSNSSSSSYFNINSYLTAYNDMGNNYRNERIYVQLMQNYLNHFMPLRLNYPQIINDKQPKASLTKSPAISQMLTNKFSVIFKANAFDKADFDSYDRDDNYHRQNSNKNTNTNSTEKLQNSLARTNIMTENIMILSNYASMLSNAVCTVFFNPDFWPSNSGFMLYEEHIRNLRVIIKHEMSFATIDTAAFLQKAKSELYTPKIIELIGNLQTSILKNDVQPFMFPMLQNIFENSSMPPKIVSVQYFRTIVELWLTFIQPWRYSQDMPSSGPFGLPGLNNNNNAEKRLSDDLENASQWLNYIVGNLDSYTILFIDALKRSLRVDISQHQECLILTRILKVFAQKNMFQLIIRANEKRNKTVMATDLSRHRSNLINQQFCYQDLSEINNPYDLQSSVNMQVVRNLIEVLQQTILTNTDYYKTKYQNSQKVKDAKRNKDGDGFSLSFKSIWQTVKDFLFLEDNLTVVSHDKETNKNFIEVKLVSSLQFLQDIFNLNIPDPDLASIFKKLDEENSSGSGGKYSPNRMRKLGQHLENYNPGTFAKNPSMDGRNYAEFDVDEDLKEVRLTERGRQQLFYSGGERHGPIIIKKHFDELSPMQSEVYVVLRVVLWFWGVYMDTKK